MGEPRYRLYLEFRPGERGCLRPGNAAAEVRFPLRLIDRYYGSLLTPDTRRLLQRLHAQADGHADEADHPWDARERERFDRRVQVAVAAVQAELGPEYAVEY